MLVRLYDERALSRFFYDSIISYEMSAPCRAVFRGCQRVNKVATSNLHHHPVILIFRDMIVSVDLIFGRGNPVIGIIGVELNPAIQVGAI